ncbi:MAG TPA: GntR family transcriptional regulator [Planctomycetota bacterium]|nr:GntR family transcriptional regulator [Planctomycetota bacterium]
MAQSPFRQNAILDVLRGEILEGTFAPGQRLPTRSELVTRFDASSVTVQRTLDTLIADGFVQPRGRSGTFVVDHPPHLFHYGLVIPGSLDQRERWPHFWRALADEAKVLFGKGPRSLTVYYGIEMRDERYYPKLLRDVQARRLAGLIFVHNPSFLLNSPVLDLPGLPRVAVAAGPRGVLSSVIGLDSQRIFDFALERFAAMGRKRIALLTVPGIEPAHREHFLAEIQRLGLTTRPEWLQAAVIDYPYWAEHITRLLFRQGQEQLPDALLITDDNLVGPATAGLKALGIRTPTDVEVVAHANFPWPTASALPITRIGFDAHQLLHLGVADLDRQRRAPERPTSSLLAPVFSAQSATVETPVAVKPKDH